MSLPDMKCLKQKKLPVYFLLKNVGVGSKSLTVNSLHLRSDVDQADLRQEHGSRRDKSKSVTAPRGGFLNKSGIPFVWQKVGMNGQ